MKSDLPLCKTCEAMEKWADGEAETKMPLMTSSFRISSSEVVVFILYFSSISFALRSEVTQMYFNGTPR